VYYSRSKPQYNDLPAFSFQSVRTAGAVGGGKTDDTDNLQHVIKSASAAGKVVYFDSGTYKITYTLFIPAGTRLVSETYPIIMSSGNFFNDINNTKPVVQVGNAGQAGQVESTDMIVSAQGAQVGVIAIKWNLAASGIPFLACGMCMSGLAVSPYPIFRFLSVQKLLGILPSMEPAWQLNC
jgi:glucan 1,3-beta-glucosidase